VARSCDFWVPDPPDPELWQTPVSGFLPPTVCAGWRARAAGYVLRWPGSKVRRPSAASDVDAAPGPPQTGTFRPQPHRRLEPSRQWDWWCIERAVAMADTGRCHCRSRFPAMSAPRASGAASRDEARVVSIEEDTTRGRDAGSSRSDASNHATGVVLVRCGVDGCSGPPRRSTRSAKIRTGPESSLEIVIGTF